MKNTRRPCCWPTAVLVALVLSSFSLPAEARTERSLLYTREEAFRCFIRMLRVDLKMQIKEKDLEAGYVLFEYKDTLYKRTSSASLELVEVPDKESKTSKLKAVLDIEREGASSEIGLLDKLESKLIAEYGKR